MSIFGQILRGSQIGIDGGNLAVYDDFWYSLVGGKSASGQEITKVKAMRLSKVYACVSLISASLSTMPLKLKIKKGSETKDATDDGRFDLCKTQPNPRTGKTKWIEYSQSQVLTGGNSYSYIERNSSGLIISIWPLEPHTVTAREAKPEELSRLKIGSRNNTVYEIKIKNQTWVYPARDILHVAGFGGILSGESVITNYARETIGNGLTLDQFQGAFFKNGIHTSGVLEHPETLGDNKEKFRKALKIRYQGADNAGVPMILEDGMKYNQFRVSLVDQQLLELMRASALDICGIFKVPPHKVAIESTSTSYNNTEQENRHYVDTTLLPWAVRWEEALNIKLLTSAERKAGYFFKFNFDALLRPDGKTRAEIAQIEWTMGVPANNYLERDDRNPVDGGDTPFVPMNFVPVDQALEPEPAPEPRQRKSIRELRSIMGRDKIRRAWAPLVKRAANKIIRLETKAVKREAEKHVKERASRSFNEFMDEFYRKMPDKIKAEFGPVIRGYMEQVRDQVSNEIGTDMLPSAFDVLVNDYITGFTRQYIDSSRGQIVGIMKESDSDFAEPVITRMDEWGEKRATKIEKNESHGIANAVMAGAVFAAGMYLVWNIRGKETCPYCKQLDGKRIRAGQYFVRAGEEIDAGEQPMKIKHNTLYAPLHGGCDCYMSPG